MLVKEITETRSSRGRCGKVAVRSADRSSTSTSSKLPSLVKARTDRRVVAIADDVDGLGLEDLQMADLVLHSREGNEG